MRLPILLLAVAQVALLFPSSYATLETRQDEIDTQTTFYLHKCSATESSAIKQAQKDALKLADAALDDAREILATDHSGGKYINFETQAAIDYFGVPSDSAPYQEEIFDGFFRASQSYPGWGFSDWWNDRRVEVHCDDILKSLKGKEGCGEDAVAYTITDPANLYPYIVYCPRYFSGLRSHQEVVNAIKADSTGQMKLNVRNLRSRAMTTLHEWLHIKPPFTAEVCHTGCVDTPQYIGGERTKTYKAGASKLLARRDPGLAKRNNDNYVYFAASRWMQKNLGAYPAYPTSWDHNLTPDQNRALEELEPGYPQDAQTLESDDWREDLESEDEDEDAVSVEPSPASVYPEWYQPVIRAVGSTTLPEIEVPKETQIALSEPDFNDVVCESSDGSPFIDDCIHAFGVMNLFPDSPVLQGHKGGTEWVGVRFCPELPRSRNFTNKLAVRSQLCARSIL